MLMGYTALVPKPACLELSSGVKSRDMPLEKMFELWL